MPPTTSAPGPGSTAERWAGCRSWRWAGPTWWARSAAVLVMPFVRSAATCASQPLKLKEYLATGRPVVACDLPSTRAWQDALDVAASPEEFAAAVVARLRTGLPESQRLARLRLE